MESNTLTNYTDNDYVGSSLLKSDRKEVDDEYGNDLVKMYLLEIGKTPLLSRYEKKILGNELGRSRAKIDLLIYRNEPYLQQNAFQNEKRNIVRKPEINNGGKDNRTIDEILMNINVKNKNLRLGDIDDLFDQFRTKTITEFQYELDSYETAILHEDYLKIQELQTSTGIAPDEVPRYKNILDYYNSIINISDDFKIDIRNKFSSLLNDYVAAIEYGKKINDMGIEDFANLTGISPTDLGEFNFIYNNITRNYYSTKDILSEHNLKLVVSIAKRELGRGLSLLDLIQEGNIGLMGSIDRFESEKGFQLSTYATWWIRQKVRRGIDDKSTLIRVPVHHREMVRKFLSASYDLNITPSDATRKEMNLIADQMKLGIHEVEKLMDTHRLSLTSSLDYTSDPDNDEPLLYYVPSTEPLPDEVMEQNNITIELQEFMDKNLNEREYRVMVLRSGLEDGRARTLEEVAREFGVTRERIRQIEEKAILKLRQKKESLKERIYSS